MSTAKKANLYEQVYLSIKEAIMKGKLKPGEKLKEAKLSEMLNASRTPVRDALRKLEIEGLVTFYPSQGAEVTSLSKDTITNLYECRAVLEGLATKKAISYMTDDKFDVLEESIVLAKRYFEKEQLEKVVEKNTLFHDTILQSSNNPSLIEMMENIRTKILRYRLITSTIGFRSTFLDEHWEIYTAMKKGEKDFAEKLMRQHVMDDLSTILSGLESYLLNNK
ncbi:GntR family transcriptional regulator [Peribacillus simplex]|uniref:GntR family transcriptional regulator n=1 Tax=Peribacillus simplex TaxID=1478 RepID=UPI0014857036|nr:GntR family transcriptional regulator [Peribacillus simplex]